MDVLTQLQAKWQEDGEHVIETSEQIVQEVQGRLLSNLKGDVSDEVFDKAFRHYEQLFDPQYGGFGGSPKFPTSHNLSFLLRYYQRSGEDKALQIVTRTLDSMQRGGIYDHIGYGFARHSVDERWLVPHFEKMLYDNALLAWTYLEAYQLTGQSDYAEVAGQIFTYVLRDMTDAEGGFYSAEDADSEGHEGKFYVWSEDEVLEVLGPDDGELYCELYDITEAGNFEGANIPNLIGQDIESFARRRRIPLETLRARVELARAKLFSYRERRVHPGKDDKILTAWNGLMIMALAKGYKTLGEDSYRTAAEKAAQFIWTRLRREDGRLLARFRDGDAAFPAYVDDYAFMVWGLLELYEATFEVEYLRQAIALNEQMLQLFWDDEQGGLYFYGSDSEKLIIRNKEIYDGAMPSGNAVAASNFLKLAKLTYDAKLSQIAERQLQAFGGAVNQHPNGHAMLLIAMDLAASAPSEIVIAGDPDSEATKRMLAEVRRGFRPHTLTIVLPDAADGEEVRRLLPLVQDKAAIGGRTTAYVCENFACQSPTTDVEELRELLHVSLESIGEDPHAG